ncbi:hepatitis A virus cellular receptor 1 homolog isoform X1 [Xiphophorus couchianus]|uniref:hepatitis A virus cellular receptor 1 homolog isoform X1 n=1 Tax=Xiphophorus couchianus TaxID=32473 RepID=UPI001016C180|nr:hepatitis A virus cellular receptor 1 homolog isoform X1 [Xiphophorus couchianus]
MKIVLLIVLLTVSGCDGRSVVGQTGQNVTLLCKYEIKDHGAVHVCWGKGEIPTYGCNNQLISTNGHKVVTSASSRYQLLEQLDQGDVSLTIFNLTEEDAGRYGCRVQINGPFNDQKHHFDFRVERAPTTWTPSEPQTSSERPAAAQTAADQLTTESLLTSCSNSSSFTQEQQQEGNMLTVVLVLVLFLLAVLLIAAGLFIMARRWKQLKLPPQQQQQLWQQVQFSSTSSTLQLQLHQRASAVENVYQIDGAADRGGDYEFCP